MTRGRRPKPDAVKRLEGNPGKRKLAALQSGEKKPVLGVKPPPEKFDPPYFVTNERERFIFSEALRELPANMVKASDLWSIGRWACWMNIWIVCKVSLDGNKHYYESDSKHGKMYREHPLAKRMNQAEGTLVTLEDRIGLNVVSRNNIVQRLFTMPHSMPPGDLFREEDVAGPNDPPGEDDPAAIDYLARARSPLPESKPN